MNESTTGPISGRQILHVSAEGEFTWHPDAGTLIETCDFSDSPAMQHILRKLWDHEHILRKLWDHEHITDGTPCWCNPETKYIDSDTGVWVIVHKESQ